MSDNRAMDREFHRIRRLPPYVFDIVNRLKQEARSRGEDVVDFGMGNPDQPAPPHVIAKLIEAAQRKDTHRYSMSRGIPRLRAAICNWYGRKFDVELDPESEAIVTIGSKEGLAHLALAMLEPGERVLAPTPAYPIHPYGCVIAGADVQYIPIAPMDDFFPALAKAIRDSWPKPKMLILNFPTNPTTDCVELEFFEKVIEVASEHRIWVVNDLAYGELVFDGYRAPSILQVPRAREIAVEFYSLSKTYNMPGWRVGFMCGNRDLVSALARIKSYLDYGLFTPVQVAAISALEGPQDCVEQTRRLYCRRRDVLCDGLAAAGWEFDKPRATMFVWAPLPEAYRGMDTLGFAKLLLERAHVAVSPGVGFGEHEDGGGHVRFSLIENEQRIRQAVRNVKRVLKG